jgi:Ala-tRNA(Pro) deacylase
MAIAPTLQKYLAAENIQYEVIPHELSMTSTRTAEACHIPGDRLAKGIVLRRDGEYVLAILPASHHLRLSELRTKLGDNVQMADETEINRLFSDCAHGAVPAVGKCYGLDIIVDDSIEAQPEIYMEAGDHETLLHMGRVQFARLMANALHGRFSAHDRGFSDYPLPVAILGGNSGREVAVNPPWRPATGPRLSGRIAQE